MKVNFFLRNPKMPCFLFPFYTFLCKPISGQDSQTVVKFERAKSLAKCSKTAIRYMRCVCPAWAERTCCKATEKIQKYNYFWLKQSFEQVFFFPEGASPLYALKEMGSISTTQGGLPWGMHWRKRHGKIRYWRTEMVYEASLCRVSKHTIVTPHK